MNNKLTLDNATKNRLKKLTKDRLIKNLIKVCEKAIYMPENLPPRLLIDKQYIIDMVTDLVLEDNY